MVLHFHRCRHYVCCMPVLLILSALATLPAASLLHAEPQSVRVKSSGGSYLLSIDNAIPGTSTALPQQNLLQHDETAVTSPKKAKDNDNSSGANQPATDTDNAPHVTSTAQRPHSSRPIRPVRPRRPDERPLWRDLHDNNFAALEKQIARLTAEFPGWHPTADMRQLMTRHTRQIHLNALLATNNIDELTTFAAQTDNGLDCTDPTTVWKVAQVLADAGKPQQAQNLLARLIPDCTPFESRLGTLYFAHDHLSAQTFADLLALETAKGQRDDKQDMALRSLVIDDQVARMAKADSDGDSEQAAAILAAISPDLIARADAGEALLAGWIRYRQRDLDGATDWFTRATTLRPELEEPRLGLALVAFQKNDYVASKKWLAGIEDPRAETLRGDLAFVDAQDAFNAEDYPAALTALEGARRHGRHDSAVDSLSAWTHFRLHDYSEATALFQQLYAASNNTDADAARGIVLSMRAARQDGELDKLRSASPGSVLADIAYKTEADPLYYAKHFTASNVRDPAVRPVLAELNLTQLSSDLAIRNRVGDAGTSAMQITDGPVLRLSLSLQPASRATLEVRQEQVDSGLPPPNVPLGSSNGGPYLVTPIRSRRGTSWYLDYEKQDWLTWSAGIGQGLHGTTGTPWIGALNADYLHDGNDWKFSLNRMPVRDSLLSYTGTIDPYSGQRWGGVTRNTLSLGFNSQIAPGTSFDTSLAGFTLGGQDVLNNQGMQASASLAYSLGWKDVDYATIGPELRYTSYQHNLSGFLLGDGGYDSPKQEIAFGPALQAQTPEGRPILWSGRLAGGILNRQTGTPECLAVNSNIVQQNCGTASTFWHGYGDAQLYGAGILTPGWQWAFGLSLRQAADYRDYAAIFRLQYTFGNRSAVFSTDLPRAAVQDLY